VRTATLARAHCNLGAPSAERRAPSAERRAPSAMAREAREAPAQELVALRSVLDERAEALEAAACVPGARALLAPAARSAAGAERLYAELEHAVERPEFADVLRREQAQRAAAEHRPAPASTASSCAHAEVLHAEWWEGDADGDDEPEAGADEAGGADTAATAAEPPADAPTQTAEIEEATGAYLAVSHADAVDALAAFLAAYLAALPQARWVVAADRAV
jgi:hypothetical protein